MIATLLIGSMSLWSFYSHANEYPDTYESTTGAAAIQPPPPEVKFSETPPVCKADDKDCIDSYLETLSKNVGGGISAQINPSPVFSSKKQGVLAGCALTNQQDCENREQDWRHIWMEKAKNMQLDFESPIGTADPGLTCKQEYDWWGLTYYYKCQ